MLSSDRNHIAVVNFQKCQTQAKALGLTVRAQHDRLEVCRGGAVVEIFDSTETFMAYLDGATAQKNNWKARSE